MYSRGQNKVNVRSSCNDRATVIAVERNAKKTENGRANKRNPNKRNGPFYGNKTYGNETIHTCIFDKAAIGRIGSPEQR